ncbi:OB-fold nucleic acid binding domain-containing protein [Nesterenkonia alba]|uniref:OB-fold nucleic acid binding domain-containing protein n=1 Tax=Nesterenkonia alba TaxID=515814 RepID=UPI0003B36FE6|nr:OB-fold nucleic acid binding domain-containing protein [Nesterenkonia alba]
MSEQRRRDADGHWRDDSDEALAAATPLPISEVILPERLTEGTAVTVTGRITGFELATDHPPRGAVDLMSEGATVRVVVRGSLYASVFPRLHRGDTAEVTGRTLHFDQAVWITAEEITVPDRQSTETATERTETDETHTEQTPTSETGPSETYLSATRTDVTATEGASEREQPPRAEETTAARITADDGPAHDEAVTLSGMVASFTHRTSARGNQYGILTLEDASGRVEVVAREKVYRAVSSRAGEGARLTVHGTVSRRDAGSYPPQVMATFISVEKEGRVQESADHPSHSSSGVGNRKNTTSKAPPTGPIREQDPLRLLGIDALERLKIPLQQLSWLPIAELQNKKLKDSGEPVRVNRSVFEDGLSIVTKLRLVLLTLVGFWLATYLVRMVLAWDLPAQTEGASAWAGALWSVPVAPALALWMGRRTYQLRAGRGALNWAGWTKYVLYLLFAEVVLFQAGIPVLSSVLFIALTEVGRQYREKLWRWRKLNERSTANEPRRSLSLAEEKKRAILPAEEIRREREWGTPGGNVADSEKTFGADATTMGVKGERMTKQLMDVFLGLPGESPGIPGVRVIHSLGVPGTDKADIDHAILCGDRLVLVDAKLYAPGDYFWLDGKVHRRRADGGAEVRGEPMVYALQRFADLFPHLQIRPVVVLHCGDETGEIRTNNVEAKKRGLPELMTPEEFLEEIGSWLVPVGDEPIRAKTLTRLTRMAV